MIPRGLRTKKVDRTGRDVYQLDPKNKGEKKQGRRRRNELEVIEIGRLGVIDACEPLGEAVPSKRSAQRIGQHVLASPHPTRGAEPDLRVSSLLLLPQSLIDLSQLERIHLLPILLKVDLFLRSREAALADVRVVASKEGLLEEKTEGRSFGDVDPGGTKGFGDEGRWGGGSDGEEGEGDHFSNL
jgi:hypothetical protein